MNQRKKDILLIYYSQSGQLQKIVNNVCDPLRQNASIQLHEIQLNPREPFPLPWPLLRFFNLFPECVYLKPEEIEPVKLDESIDYDLIILAYQPWFLSPSMPVTAFLQSDTARHVLKTKPVITLIGCRNMWTQAQLDIQRMLAALNAKLIDNVVLIDQGSTMASFITTPRWMLTGRKNAFWGLPAAGIADKEIEAASRFGKAISAGLAKDLEKTGQPMLTGLAAVKANVGVIQSENIGKRSFRIWGRLLMATGNRQSRSRKIVLIFYIIFLVSMILSVVPMVLLMKWLTRPLFKTRNQMIKNSFEMPSGSGTERMEQFTCQK